MLTGKLTSKGQVTVPKEVREKLGLTTGDDVMFFVEGDVVRIKKTSSVDDAWHRSVELMVAPEWSSPEDDEAFGDLQCL